MQIFLKYHREVLAVKFIVCKLHKLTPVLLPDIQINKNILYLVAAKKLTIFSVPDKNSDKGKAGDDWKTGVYFW